MKQLTATFIGFFVFFIFIGLGEAKAQYEGTGSNTNSEYVEGYYKDNGTYVEGYYRTKANSYNLDNYSAEGNYNPYTGDYGDVEYESPYNSYGSSNNSYYSREMEFNSTDYSNSYDYDLDY